VLTQYSTGNAETQEGQRAEPSDPLSHWSVGRRQQLALSDLLADGVKIYPLTCQVNKPPGPKHVSAGTCATGTDVVFYPYQH